MAKFQLELPLEIIRDIEKVEKDTDKILGGMTKAGAEVVLNNAKSTVPIPELASHIKLSETYKTPSDDAINTKVYVSGYLPFSNGRTTFTRRAGGREYSTNKGVPAAFVANVYEYGTSNRQTDAGANRGKMNKTPFFRKSFKKAQIESAMLKAQRQLSGGLLDE